MNDALRRNPESPDRTISDRWCAAVKTMFETRNASLPELLALYREDARFRDPLSTLVGRAALSDYNAAFLQKTRRVEVTFGDVLEGDHTAFASWTMVVTPKLGPKVRVEGVSRLVIEDEEITLQQDTFDVTQVVPVIGSLLRRLVRVLGA